MLFSIIIPVYNVEKYIDECIESILPQVEKLENNCEILLIDDGSTDKSGIICDKYKEKYSDIIKVYHKKNEGLLATRRYGFKRAKGDYIINCDSDDLLENNMLQSVKRVIEKYNTPDIIFINHNVFDGETKSIGYENIFANEHDCEIAKAIVLRKYLSGHCIVSVWGKIIKRSCINIKLDYAEYDRLSTGEDTLQSIEFFTNASTFVYLNEALYDYRCGSGMTTKFDINYYFTFKRIFEQIEKEKDVWNLEDFDRLFAIKVLQTAGRAITQSRYKKWNSVREHKEYLKNICNDFMLMKSLRYLKMVKDNLQFDHYILLKLLRKKFFSTIIIMLKIKNNVSQR